MQNRSVLSLCVLLVVWLSWQVETNYAFFSNGRWTFTATDGPTGTSGSPTTLTWSIVPDGTPIPGRNPSNLIAFFDGLYGSGDGGIDLQTRPWFKDVVAASFDRWTALSGLTFQYEQQDDGATLGNFSGILETRGDIRLGGTFLDGQGGTSAQAGFIPNGDITVDTGDSLFYANPTDNFLNLRNTLTHEVGHSLGLGHIDSTASFLMEPSYNGTFDGPQIDDLRGVHQLYGDSRERGSMGPQPNNTLETATNLGILADGQSLQIGTDITASTVITSSQTDFLSIANLNDVDFFSFTIESGSILNVVLTPSGPNYFEKISGAAGSQTITRSSQVSNLKFDIYGPASEGSAELLTTVDAAPIGQIETLQEFMLATAGEYFVRVSGSTNDVQLYKLSLSGEALSNGDFDEDGDVDGADFLDWQRGFGPLYGENDLAAWQNNYGIPLNTAAAVAVPEPPLLSLLYSALVVSYLFAPRCFSFWP
ncbi:matrixin family metalloprotease [Bythopirellula goksoeyrii]|uniref:Matrixin n=1 Tax=Bythopirellula goksoeyrii TaxID=1400387 RepID=A0A5B9QEH0_9BACT|nr:matrixin family metalloprotease [Bythopirellula goksoeyrii]QEG37437.1 Matrixin [Bythopirellula goksoeyrii]